MKVSPYSLDDKLVLITGGGSGLGLGMAKSVINAGGKVVITGRTEQKLIDVCEELGPRAFYVVNDITDLPSIPGLVKDIEEKYGPIYGLVNNAGIPLLASALDTSDDDFLKLLNIHCRAAFALTRECVRYMIERQAGSVIFICSMASTFGMKNACAYTAGKSAVKGLVRSFAMEYSQYNIRFNDIAPGWIMSQMLVYAKERDPGRWERIWDRTPLGRFGEPEDIGNAAVFLLSDAAKFINATEIRVDGGISNAGI